MRKSILNSLYVVIGLFSIVACAPKKVVVAPPPPVEAVVSVGPDKNAETLELLKSKNFNYNTLSLKGKAKLNLNGEENNVNILIKIKTNEQIWISVSAVIGEVARVSITPDSIRIINRLETTYTKKAFNYIHQFTNKSINFSVLQAILSGNTIEGFISPEATAEMVNGVWTIAGSKEELDYKFLFNTLLKISETNLNDVKAGQALKVVYGDYQKLNEALFPSKMTINSMAGTKKIDVDLDFSSIEGNVELDLPFTVRSRFQIIN